MSLKWSHQVIQLVQNEIAKLVTAYELSTWSGLLLGRCRAPPHIATVVTIFEIVLVGSTPSLIAPFICFTIYCYYTLSMSHGNIKSMN